MKKFNRRINKLGQLSQYMDRGKFTAFAPGLFFVLLAVVTLVAPGFLIAVLAGLFLFIGVAFCVIAWKFMQLKRKAEEFTKQFQGRVFIHGLNVQDPMEDAVYEEREEKKVILH